MGSAVTREDLPAAILDLVKQARARYEQLVLVVGAAGSGKTAALREVERQAGYPYRSIGLEASQRLLDVPVQRRRHEVRPIVEAIVDEAKSDVVLLDNLEVLFDRSLELNPLNLLRSISRDRVVVAAWAGSVEGGYLTYAVPGHPEFRRYVIEGTAVLLV